MDYSRYTTFNLSRRGPNDSVLDIQMKAANGKLPTAGHDGLDRSDEVHPTEHTQLARKNGTVLPSVTERGDLCAVRAPPRNGRRTLVSSRSRGASRRPVA